MNTHEVTISWNCGQFTIAGKYGVPESAVAAILTAGTTHLSQRAKGIDEALGLIDKVNGKNKRNGKKRGQIPFSETIAAKLAGLQSTLEYDGHTIVGSVQVSKYVPAASGIDAQLETTARAAISAHESANDVETWAVEKIGFTGELYTDDAGEDYTAEFVAAVVVKVREMLARPSF